MSNGSILYIGPIGLYKKKKKLCLFVFYIICHIYLYQTYIGIISLNSYFHFCFLEYEYKIVDLGFNFYSFQFILYDYCQIKHQLNLNFKYFFLKKNYFQKVT